MWLIRAALMLFALAFITGCTKKPENPSAEKLSQRVVATTYPYQFFAQQLLGPEFIVQYPPADADNPRIWQPTPGDIENMQQADLIITGGTALPYAEWITKISLSESKICSCSKSMKLAEFMHIEDYRVVHQHGPEGQHSHPLLIPYAWLNPSLAKKQVAHIAERLKSVYPNRSAAIDTHWVRLNQQLDELATQWKELKNPAKTVICTTPNLSFITRALGVENDYLLWLEPSGDATEEAKRIEEITARVADNESFVCLYSGAFAKQTLLKAFPNPKASSDQKASSDPNVFSDPTDGGPGLGPNFIEIDLFDHAPKNGDYLEQMNAMLARIREAIK